MITQTNGSQTADVRQGYLVDPLNHTGLPQVLEEHAASGVVDVTFVYGSATIFQVTHASGGDQYRYFLVDGHNSTRLLTDEHGNVTDRFDYDAYGNSLDFDPTTAATTRLYDGYTFDRGTGLYFLDARYYDASARRFDQSDPYAGSDLDPQSLNKYAYAQGDPVNYSDPTGRSVGSDNLIEEISSLGRGGYVHRTVGGIFTAIDPANRRANYYPIYTILGIPETPDTQDKPDLITLAGGYDVYEIKPNNSYYRGNAALDLPPEGPLQLLGYLHALVDNDPMDRAWRRGLQSTFTAQPIPNIYDGGVFRFYQPSGNGDPWNPNNQQGMIYYSSQKLDDLKKQLATAILTITVVTYFLLVLATTVLLIDPLAALPVYIASESIFSLETEFAIYAVRVTAAEAANVGATVASSELTEYLTTGPAVVIDLKFAAELADPAFEDLAAAALKAGNKPSATTDASESTQTTLVGTYDPRVGPLLVAAEDAWVATDEIAAPFDQRCRRATALRSACRIRGHVVGLRRDTRFRV